MPEKAFKEYGADAAMYQYSGWNPYATLEMAQNTVRGFIDQYADKHFYGWVMESDDVLLGTIGAYDYKEDQIEAGFSVKRACWGLGIDRSRIIVGGESAGGGLAAALCMYARDKGEVPVSFQIPLYPMLDCEDTASSRDNHAHGWNTKRNHWGWGLYLRDLYGTDHVPPYASPARAKDYSSLPPCYTYIEDGEPFYYETLTYVRNLREAGVEAYVDIFHGNTHGFDFMFWTQNAKDAKRKLIQAAEKYMR